MTVTEYVNDGKSALWDRKEEAPETAPVLKGHAYAHRDIKKGEKVELSYWKNERYVKGGKHPRLNGKMRDVYNAQLQPETPPPIEPTPADLDDPMDW